MIKEQASGNGHALSLEVRFQEMLQQRDRLDEFASDVEHLVTAMQMILFDLAGTSIEDPHLKRLRSALIGTGDALEGVVEAST